MAFIGTILSVFGSGLGTLFSWIVGLFVARKAAQDAASAQMNQDVIDHAQDGKISVGESQSAEAQLSDLDQQLKQIDQGKPTVVAKGP